MIIKFNKLEVVLFLLFIVVISVLFVKSNIEGFTSLPLNSGLYNENAEFFAKKETPSLNAKNINDIVQDNGIDRRLARYDQKTNNAKHRTQPDNGSCTPSDVCNTLYKDVPLKQEIASSPPDIFHPNRVNYYVHNENDSL
jgi:hypothetical protein